MLEKLTTEARNVDSEGIDELSAIEIVRLMNSHDAGVARAVLEEADRIAHAIETIADRLRTGGRLIYLGAGTSGRLGVLDAAECPPTFNTPPELVVGLIAGGPAALTRAVEGAEDHPELAVADLDAIALCDRDVVVGIATSGRTPYVIGGLAHARTRGAFTIGFSCVAEPKLAAACELTITPIVGPEVITGSTRLKSGTATKLTLNMLTTGAMVLLGKTYGNLMVDLRATNNKLLDRTRRIVMMLTGLAKADAEALLARCDGELKTAVVAHERQANPVEARRLLDDAGGQLRRALTPVGRAVPTSIDDSAESNAERHRPSRGDPSLVLGIDGGGSKTAAWLARRETDGRWSIIGKGAAGGSNPQSLGFDRALGNVDAAIDTAFAAAGHQRSPVAAACLAMAGAEREADRNRVAAWAAARQVADNLQHVHDALPLLAAGTPDGWGIAVIAGTGSFVFGQDSGGRTARAGGWGYLFGDEGSGYVLTLQALRAATKAADERGQETSLLARFVDKFQLRQPLDLIGAVYQGGADRRTIASWSDIVFEEAARGDAVAKTLISRAAGDLAETIAAVCRKLGFDQSAFPVALSGGLFIHHARYRELVQQELSQRKLSPAPTAVVADPVAGAVILAQRMIDAPGSR
ncbi:MAG: N-acetylmuramic acid 6-phosphate etherase [Planctomycetia bacterium]|nr:N-acetylmuramic acid 6-phosphate etherase [Planctomycetia bacterium]